MVAAVSGLQHVVVMGVSGCGKSTLGEALARDLGWSFVEGDARHPPENVAKMASGVPLTDADRDPWLRALAAEIASHQAAGGHVVMGCSALKRAYRDILRGGAPRVRFLHMWGDPAILAERLGKRAGHFFPASLLDSQIATLEHLDPDEDGTIIDIAWPPEEQLRRSREWLGV